MKTARATLSGSIMLVMTLSLLTSVTLGADRPIGDYGPSSNGFYPEDGILKASKDCPLGSTFIKNAFPSLTNGQDGSVVPRQETYFIGLGPVSIPVTVEISWLADNSFRFDIFNGNARIVGVTSDTKNFLYDYVNFYTAVNRVTPPTVVNEPVSADGNLNSAFDAADVNHLDFCLEAVDELAPSIQITSPVNTATVSGTVIVTATVRDFVEVGTVTATVESTAVGSVPIQLASGSRNCVRDAEGYEVCEFEWSWNSTTEIDGTYTITIVAADTSGNDTTDSVSVSLENSVSACVGVIGPDDPDQGEGCNPSGVQNVQVPPDNKLDTCTPNDPNAAECSITEFLLTPNPTPDPLIFADPEVLDICSGQYAFADPRVRVDGVPLRFEPLDVFLELGGGTAGDLILDEFTFGNPCFAVVKGARNFDLTDAFFWPVDPPTGLVVIRTQFAAFIPGGIGPLTQCYDEVANPDLQQAGEATYSRDLTAHMIEGAAAVMTNRCFNPLRVSSPDFSFNILNTKEHGGIDFFGSPTGPDDVLEFKFQRASAKFDALEIALDRAQQDLISPKFADLTKLFNQARSQFNKKNSDSLARALEDLDALLTEVKEGEWVVTDGDPNDANHPSNRAGDVQMRVHNLWWRVLLMKRAFENSGFPVN